MALTFSDVMKLDLGIITKDKSKAITVIIRADTSVETDFGYKNPTTLHINTTAIINPVLDTKAWEPDGFLPGGRLKCKIWELESGGVDYMTREYFTDNRVDNMLVLIGTIYYRITAVESPESINDTIPYMIFDLVKQEAGSS